MTRFALAAAVTLSLMLAGSAGAADLKLKAGNPGVKSAGALAFGPDGVLFIGDAQSAAVFAIATGEPSSGKGKAVNVKGINSKIAALLGTTARDILINDVAVNPATGTVYLSVSRGRGPKAMPAIVRVKSDGKLSQLSLKKARFAKAELPNAPAAGGTGRRNRRAQVITDLHYLDGKLIIAGLSNEEFASKLRVIPFPFADPGKGASIEIFHGAHGRFETRSPVRTFVPFNIGGKPHILAAYTCTPLVKFPVADLVDGKKIKGTTIAELGNRNRPYDIIVYKKDGKDYLLMANSARGVMKISTENIEKIKGITKRVGGGGKAGLPYETIENLKGVIQLDKLNDKQAVILVRGESGSLNLKTIDLP